MNRGAVGRRGAPRARGITRAWVRRDAVERRAMQSREEREGQRATFLISASSSSYASCDSGRKLVAYVILPSGPIT
jgi:hypothetical protein